MSSPLLAWRLQDGEDDVLLARAGHAFEAHGLGHLGEFDRRLHLEFVEVQEVDAAFELALGDHLVFGEGDDLLVLAAAPPLRGTPAHVVAAAAVLLVTAATTTDVAIGIAAAGVATAAHIATAAATALGAITG